jgi:hypothetical protein
MFTKMRFEFLNCSGRESLFRYWHVSLEECKEFKFQSIRCEYDNVKEKMFTVEAYV